MGRYSTLCYRGTLPDYSFEVIVYNINKNKSKWNRDRMFYACDLLSSVYGAFSSSINETWRLSSTFQKNEVALCHVEALYVSYYSVYKSKAVEIEIFSFRFDIFTMKTWFVYWNLDLILWSIARIYLKSFIISCIALA